MQERKTDFFCSFFLVFQVLGPTKPPTTSRLKPENMAGPTCRTGSRGRLSTNNARLTLHHPSLRHNHRTTEGNAQDSQGLRVLSGEVCLLPGSLQRSPHLTRKDGFGDGFGDGFWDGFWDGFFEPYFSCAKRGRIFLR